MTIFDEPQTRLEQYYTQDGGSNWDLVGLMSGLASIQPGTTVTADLIGSNTIVAVDAQTSLLYTTEDAKDDALKPASASIPEGVVEIEFISAQEGWVKTVNSSCSGTKSEKVDPGISCTFLESLWMTVDGGVNWQEIR